MPVNPLISMKSTAQHILFSALLVGSAIIPTIAGAQAPQREYTLFEGANIGVNLDKSVYPVRDVFGASWVIDINGQEKAVSAKEAPVDLKITPALKMTEQSATIAGFKREPGYSFANDPAVRLTRGMSVAADVNAGYQAAANQASAVNPTAISASSPTSNAGGADDAQVAAANAMSAAQISSANSGADASTALQEKNATSEGYDAMNIEFEVSSAKPLADPYIVTMIKFHPKNSGPGIVQSMVYAKALNPIDDHPTKIKFAQEGFPFDYQVVDFQLHLYNHGIEVATNISPKRQEMTPEQAFEYVKTTYITAHKTSTLPASPVMGELPPDLSSQLAAGKYNEQIYVKVSKDGLADEAYSDAACTDKIADPYLETVVRSIRFKPALEQGKPVDGVATLNLSRLRV
jgi:hypothetical protein